MASVSGVKSVSLFQAARERLERDIGDIILCLSNKKTELFEEIDSLEKEFVNKQRERQKDITKLNTLIAQTEELGQNTLLSVQHKILHNLQQEKLRLKLDSDKGPEYQIVIKCGSFTKSNLIVNINKFKIERVDKQPPKYSVPVPLTPSYHASVSVEGQNVKRPQSRGYRYDTTARPPSATVERDTEWKECWESAVNTGDRPRTTERYW